MPEVGKGKRKNGFLKSSVMWYGKDIGGRQSPNDGVFVTFIIAETKYSNEERLILSQGLYRFQFIVGREA